MYIHKPNYPKKKKKTIHIYQHKPNSTIPTQSKIKIKKNT